MADVKRISEANIMPDYLNRLQYKTDSIRAWKWFNITNDSNYIRKYMPHGGKKTAVLPAAVVKAKPAVKNQMINKNLYAKRSTTDKRNP
jgi:penicillin-binding protein 2